MHTPMFISQFIITNIWKQSKCPLTDEYIYIHTYAYIYVYTHIYIFTMQYYSATKKNEVMPFIATWTDLESIILSGINQTEKKISCIIYMWNLKYVNGLIYKTNSDVEKKLMVTKG